MPGDIGRVATPDSRLSEILVTTRKVLAHSLELYLRALLAATAAVALFFLLSYAATFVDRQSIAAKLEAANARHAFSQTWAAATGREIPRFGGSDCLFLATLLKDYPNRLAHTICTRIPPAGAQPRARA